MQAIFVSEKCTFCSIYLFFILCRHVKNNPDMLLKDFCKIHAQIIIIFFLFYYFFVVYVLAGVSSEKRRQDLHRRGRMFGELSLQSPVHKHLRIFSLPVCRWIPASRR